MTLISKKKNRYHRKLIKLFPVLICLLCLIQSPVYAQHLQFKKISPANKDLVYAGRINFSNPAQPIFYWAGNSATISFTGTKVAVILDDAKGNNYFDVIVDRDGSQRHVIACKKGRHIYLISNHLTAGRHTIQIFRRTDPTWLGTKFDGIEIGKKATVFKPDIHHKLKIAYYGDSITSGYGVLSQNRKNEARASVMDNYDTYDAMTARHFNAAFRAISRSGIGITKSWFPLVMPQMYDRLNPNDSHSHWDFSKWTPDIVVINLFQNDKWLVAREKNPPSKQQIIQAYVHFVKSLLKEYPKATYICMLGNMDITSKGSPWPGYVKQAVNDLRKDGFHKIYNLDVPYKQTIGHPNIAEQHAMENYLINKIDKVYFHH